MIAFKCDRCGVYYDKHGLSHSDNTEYAVNGRFITLTDQYHRNVDLCPECYEKFISFMKNNTGYDNIKMED